MLECVTTDYALTSSGSLFLEQAGKKFWFLSSSDVTCKTKSPESSADLLYF